jgi:hypothetical protein
VVHLLCEYGADAGKAGADGATAFTFASQCGHLEAVRLLCEAGADTDTWRTCPSICITTAVPTAFRRPAAAATSPSWSSIAIFAAMGYITPELGFKLDGYPAPSANPKFADVPNGLKALSIVPAARSPGPDPRLARATSAFKLLTFSDPAQRPRSLTQCLRTAAWPSWRSSACSPRMASPAPLRRLGPLHHLAAAHVRERARRAGPTRRCLFAVGCWPPWVTSPRSSASNSRATWLPLRT